MNKKINIGIEIDLQKLLDTRLLIQAGSGGGKSFALRKVIESIGNQVQQIIIDPEGEFVTLREKFDFALVSKDGDIPLSLKYAEMLAHKVLETNLSVIIDLYELKHHERILFVKRFLDALINAPKEFWHPCFVHVDEAHIFCPESAKSESMSAVIDLCTRGRKRGFAGILATQRLSKLHKDAAAECLNKMIGRTGLDIDRKRAGDELGLTGKSDLIALRELEPGEFNAFGPAISNEVVKFKVGKVLTTHLQSGSRLSVNPPTPNAVKKILTKLADIPEEAEKELQTKQQLQDEVKRLKTELRKNTVHVKPADNKTIEIALNKQKAELHKEFTGTVSKWKLYSGKLLKHIQQAGKEFQSALGHQAPEEIKLPEIKISYTPPATIISSAKPERVKPAEGNGNLGRCPLAILQFLASYPDREFSKAQVGISVGYSPQSGGFNNALAELNSKGLIMRNNGNLIVNDVPELQDYTGPIERKEYSIHTYASKLAKCEREIYEILLQEPERAFTKEELGNATPTGYSSGSGGFNNALASLNTLELIKRENGKVKLNPELLELM